MLTKRLETKVFPSPFLAQKYADGYNSDGDASLYAELLSPEETAHVLKSKKPPVSLDF
jgi:hypothetical protein